LSAVALDGGEIDPIATFDIEPGEPSGAVANSILNVNESSDVILE
jgi:hypothetical protein